jgi:hypothetical protein
VQEAIGAIRWRAIFINQVALCSLLALVSIQEVMTKRDLPIKEVKSSNVAGYHYDPANQQLHIKFKTGKTYAYAGVPQAAVDTLLKADSFGSHVSRHIIPNFKVIK